MAYIVEPLLATLSDQITRGLANGSLQRWGGIIRVTKGYPGAGEIVTHLRDVVSVASQVSTPASAANLVSSVAANVQLHQVSSQLSQVMQLTQVAAAASVLNLGVSAVGFAVMNHKLNRLQESVGKLDGRLVQLAADNSRRFDDIDGKLVELRYLATLDIQIAQEALAGIEAIRAELFNDKMARIIGWAGRLERTPQPDQQVLENAIHAFDEVRLSLQAGLGVRGLQGGADPRWVDELLRYRLWCTASSAAVLAMRRADQTSHALRLAQEVAAKSRSLAQGWQQSLMPAMELGGVLRLGHSRFHTEEPVLLETRRRLARLQIPGGLTDAELHASSVEVATEVAHALPSLPENWLRVQSSAAAVLDFVEESTERLESTAAEMAFCERRRLRFEQWEGLPLPETSEGLALVRLEKQAA